MNGGSGVNPDAQAGLRSGRGTAIARDLCDWMGSMNRAGEISQPTNHNGGYNSANIGTETCIQRIMPNFTRA